MQPQVKGRDKEDGRVAEPEDLRVWSLSSFAGGAAGMMNLRYRPLLNGPLFGAFGSYGMDGSRTARSEMAAGIARWANDPAQAGLFAARPVRGDLGIVVVPEVQEFDYLLSHEGGFDTYAAAMFGTYQGFFDNNILVDWVQLADIDAYDLLYFPYPICLKAAQAKRLMEWVEAGGTLICEACPGYFGDHGKAGTTQPNHGLDALFGCKESEVEFMPDIADRYTFTFDGLTVTCGGFLQAYTPFDGEARGLFSDNRCAMVENSYGKGRSLLVGSHPGVTYHRNATWKERAYFAKALEWSGKTSQVQCNNKRVQVRLQKHRSRYLWIVNPTDQSQSGMVKLRDGGVSLAGWHWGENTAAYEDGAFRVAAKDALVVRLQD